MAASLKLLDNKDFNTLPHIKSCSMQKHLRMALFIYEGLNYLVVSMIILYLVLRGDNYKLYYCYDFYIYEISYGIMIFDY